ncbi:MAG TPA: aminoglycoside phosphotransferase family protein [Bacillota bacterium]|nr:aminoglycoside phosphotransferase family protein [Bacillota bacterium]HOA14788.1 aminoglycoside phosphotransferase family protein [Bacillota bacterium]HOG52559.1 aminoglycoside phosphotransferase family protein [Bacillota bacterium]
MDEWEPLIKGAFPGFALMGRLHRGWSSDVKYRLYSEDHGFCLIRLSRSVALNKRQETARMMEIAISAGLSSPLPLACGTLPGGITYILQTWLEGTPLDDVLSTLGAGEQYALGRRAGKMLAGLHNARVSYDAPDFGLRTVRRIKRKLEAYSKSADLVPRAVEALEFIRDNLGLLRDRPSLPQHGDFHPGNMLINGHGNISLIDFDRCGYGDPYEEFYKAQFFARPLSEHFINGQIHSYFDDCVPASFWPLFKLYLAEAVFYSPVWALPFGSDQVRHLSELSKTAADDFGSFTFDLPVWYISSKEYQAARQLMPMPATD